MQYDDVNMYNNNNKLRYDVYWIGIKVCSAMNFKLLSSCNFVKNEWDFNKKKA